MSCFIGFGDKSRDNFKNFFKLGAPDDFLDTQ